MVQYFNLMGKKLTIEEFIIRANSIHHHKYDYSQAEYINSSTEIKIICPEHGVFWQIPNNHIHKTHPRGCPQCNGGVSFEYDECVRAV